MKFGVQSVHIRIVQVGIQKLRNNRGQFVPQLKIPCSENLDKSRDVVCKAPRNVGNELGAPIALKVAPILVVNLKKKTPLPAIVLFCSFSIGSVGHSSCWAWELRDRVATF